MLSIEQLLHNNKEWKYGFSKGALERGSKYAREQRVELLKVDNESIHACCRGGEGNVYEQMIELAAADVGDGQYLECFCSCPVRFDCKHCAAVLFYLAGFEPREQDKEINNHLSPQLERWLNSIPTDDIASDIGQKTSDTQLLYKLVSSRVTGKWQVELYQAKRSKDGGLRDLRRHTLAHQTLRRTPGYLLESDLQIARLVVASFAHSDLVSGFELNGRVGAALLELLLGTSRLFLDFDAHQPLVMGPTRAADFSWAEQSNGYYRAQWLCSGQSPDALLALEPLYYLDFERMEAGPLQHELTDKLACHLLLAPDIAAKHAVEFSHRLRAVVDTVPAPRTLTERIVTDIEPIAHLTLGSLALTGWRAPKPFEHRAALTFSYDGQFVTDKKSTEVLRLSGSETLRIQRQPAAEKALRKALLKTGFKRVTGQKGVMPGTMGEFFDQADDEAWIGFVQTGLEHLRASGWQIEIKQGFHFELQDVEQWYADIEEGPEHAWFDLELGIEVNGQRYSLLPILLNLLRSKPQLLDPQSLSLRGDNEPLLVDLNYSPYEYGARKPALNVVLPYGRIKPLMATLSELYLKAPRGDSLRLSALDAGRLSALDDVPLVWQGGERQRDFARRLKQSEHTVVSAPEGLNATLRPYQQEGLNWMQALRELEVGGILGDDMGLGKTLQTLAHLLQLKRSGQLKSPALAIMPTSLIPNWLDESARFTPQLKVLALHGANRQKDFATLADYDLVLSTYALLPRDMDVLEPHIWSVLILDEAQNIKNPAGKAAQAARQLQAGQRLCLSGTPLENHLGELWSLFHFLLPGWLGDSKTFNRDYRTPIEKHGNSERMHSLTARIKPFLLRRTKEQVATELPPKTEIIHWVELSEAQRDVYETVRVAMDKKVRDEITRNGIARSQIIILEALLKLRQVCCDLRLVKTETVTKAAHPLKGKLGSLMEIIQELLDEGRRILLFSQFTSMLSLIEQELVQRKVAYSLLTGDTKDRRTPVKNFQDGKTPLFLISLKAGGTGLNLTAADTVIHYDPWWNPAVENQATDRAYRIGQDKPVFVYKLIARGTVEEKIQALQQKKAHLAAGVLEGGLNSGWKLEQSDIDALFAPLKG